MQHHLRALKFPQFSNKKRMVFSAALTLFGLLSVTVTAMCSRRHGLYKPSSDSSVLSASTKMALTGETSEIEAMGTLLKELNGQSDPLSLEGRMRFLLEKHMLHKPLWHQEMQLHAVLGQYLATVFPHASTRSTACIDSTRVLFKLLERKLYPWIPDHFRDSLELQQNAAGRGLVTSVPSKYTDLALTIILGLRTIIGCDTPIHVYFADEDDISAEGRRKLNYVDNVFTFNLAAIYSVPLKGFQVKPFAILASGFAEVVWFDADLAFMVNPERLFDSGGYHETGSVFYHDRTLFGWGSEPGANIDWKWVHGIIGRGSDYLRSSPAFAGRASNIVDSSAVVMNVKRNVFAMLVISWLNLNPETYAHVWGDKETFWLGFEILLQSWNLNPWGMSGVTFLERSASECTGASFGQGGDLPACGHMGPQGIVEMIHFSESKRRGPAPFTVPPVGYVVDVNKSWHATCVQYGAADLKSFRQSQIGVFQNYIDLHMNHRR